MIQVSCGRARGLYHYIFFHLENLRWDAQAQPLKQNGDVAADVGSDPDARWADGDGDGPHLGEIAEYGDCGKLTRIDRFLADGAASVFVAFATQSAGDVGLAQERDETHRQVADDSLVTET